MKYVKVFFSAEWKFVSLKKINPWTKPTTVYSVTWDAAAAKSRKIHQKMNFWYAQQTWCLLHSSTLLEIYGSKIWRFYLHLCFTQFHQNKEWHKLNLDFISSFPAQNYNFLKMFTECTIFQNSKFLNFLKSF